MRRIIIDIVELVEARLTKRLREQAEFNTEIDE